MHDDCLFVQFALIEYKISCGSAAAHKLYRHPRGGRRFEESPRLSTERLVGKINIHVGIVYLTNENCYSTRKIKH